MPNYAVFNPLPEQLKVQIFGSETASPISTTDGRLNIESISAPVTVTATDLDIRNLVYTQDTLRIYGSEDTPISTTDGRLNIESISAPVTVTSTDLDIRNLLYSQDTIRIYGSEDTPISTTDGRLNIESISAPVTVTVTDLDIRDLTYTQDTVRIYGSETYALETTLGRLNIRHRSRYFVSDTATTVTTTSTTYTGLLAQDVSELTHVSFAVHNRGSGVVSIKIEVSPDASLWITDTEAMTVAANSATVFVPKYFLKYARLAYASLTADSAITFDAWFQAAV
ncbi:MAG: DUF6385 domain-containing protein [Moorellales bacterium]